MTLRDGERVKIHGSTAEYELSRKGPVFACTCPAWAKQRSPPAQRTCKHLRAHLGDEHEDTRVGQTRVDAAMARARKSALAAPRDPPDLRAHRQAAFAATLARFDAAAARMRAVYDMPLPRHLAPAIGFWNGLTRDEREEAWSHFGCGPSGVGEWLEEGGLDRRPALDERLHYRYRRDPPEFVTVCSGNSDGSHWGLWYDDPRELPRVIAHNWARDSSENGACKPTLLASLRDDFTRERHEPGQFPHAKRILAWLDECLVHEIAAHGDEKIGPPHPRTYHTIGGLDPVVRGATVPAEFTVPHSSDARLKVYRDDPELARTWIAEARRELAAGRPLRALYLARELHWNDDDPLRDEARDLGVDAYNAVDRPQLAEVLRVHCQHRDLRSVDIYLPPDVPALVTAACDLDAARVDALLADDPDPASITAALASTRDPAMLDRLLAAAPPHADADLLALTVDRVADLRRHGIDDPLFDVVLDHLLARPAIDSAPAFTRALDGDLPALAARLAPRLDVTRKDPQGLYPLHRAIVGGAVQIVRDLLARGADPHARDSFNKTPHDRAREIWQARRKESLEILALLPAPPVAPKLAALAVGDAVQHDKFGLGRVVATSGAGIHSKATVDFSDGQRTLLSKFVRRA